ncbi:MAG: DUF928 domain-containing protein [Cyanobacteria bacterium P01_H01_bin.26]
MSIQSRCIQALLTAVMVAAAGPSYAVQFPDTSDVGAPARGPSLGTRGELCLDPEHRPSLTSLLPHNAIATAFGADPDIPLSLWFYIPETIVTSAELTVIDELGNEIHQQLIELPATPGTIQAVLPRYQADGVTPLFTAGSLYYWDFALICDPADRGDDVVLAGGIQRLDASPDFLARLESTAGDRLAQAGLYAEAGAWQETIALVATMRSQRPDTWSELLTSVGLASVAEKPIVRQAGPVPATPNAVPSGSGGESGGEPGALTSDSQINLQRLLEGIN